MANKAQSQAQQPTNSQKEIKPAKQYTNADGNTSGIPELK